jgi:hypothetical protein
VVTEERFARGFLILGIHFVPQGLEEAVCALKLSVVVLAHLFLTLAPHLLADHVKTLDPLLGLTALAPAAGLKRIEKQIFFILGPWVIITGHLVDLLTCCALVFWLVRTVVHAVHPIVQTIISLGQVTTAILHEGHAWGCGTRFSYTQFNCRTNTRQSNQ